ncbi:hypothetical protein Tco_0648114 [Tanacetum coccineum]
MMLWAIPVSSISLGLGKSVLDVAMAHSTWVPVKKTLPPTLDKAPLHSSQRADTDEELREFTSEYYIPSALHPVVPARGWLVIAGFPRGSLPYFPIALHSDGKDIQFRDATSIGSSEDADVAEVDSGLKRKRATGDDGAGARQRGCRHLSLASEYQLVEDLIRLLPLAQQAALSVRTESEAEQSRAFEVLSHNLAEEKHGTALSRRRSKSGGMLRNTKCELPLWTCELFGGGVKNIHFEQGWKIFRHKVEGSVGEAGGNKLRKAQYRVRRGAYPPHVVNDC